MADPDRCDGGMLSGPCGSDVPFFDCHSHGIEQMGSHGDPACCIPFAACDPEMVLESTGRKIQTGKGKITHASVSQGMDSWEHFFDCFHD